MLFEQQTLLNLVAGLWAGLGELDLEAALLPEQVYRCWYRCTRSAKVRALVRANAWMRVELMRGVVDSIRSGEGIGGLVGSLIIAAICSSCSKLCSTWLRVSGSNRTSSAWVRRCYLSSCSYQRTRSAEIKAVVPAWVPYGVYAQRALLPSRLPESVVSGAQSLEVRCGIAR